MSTPIFGQLARFVGLSTPQKNTASADLHLNRLIACQRHVLNHFQHIGKKALRLVVSSYPDANYETVLPHEMLDLICALLQIDQQSSLSQRRVKLLDDVLSSLIYLRINCQHKFSVRALQEALSLRELIDMSNNLLVPKVRRDSLMEYLEDLPDYRNSRLFEEPLQLITFQAHQDFLKDVRDLLTLLAQPAVNWLKGQVSQASALHKQGGANIEKAHQRIQELWAINQRYNLMDVEDLHFEFLWRDCRFDVPVLGVTRKGV